MSEKTLRKEYSDLPKNEKKTYTMLQIMAAIVTITIATSLLLPLIVITATTQTATEIQNESMKKGSLRQAFDYLYEKTSEQLETILNMMLYLLILSMIGVMTICLVVVEFLQRHYKLYTQIDLERAEKRVKRIKESLE